jgi:hypothetical protein
MGCLCVFLFICIQTVFSKPDLYRPNDATSPPPTKKLQKGVLYQGAQKLVGENLKLVRDEFSTISQAVYMMRMYLSK